MSTVGLVGSFAFASAPAGALVGVLGGSASFTVSFSNGGTCQVQDAMTPNSGTFFLGSSVNTSVSVACNFGVPTDALAQLATPTGALYCSNDSASFSTCGIGSPKSGTTYDSADQVIINADGIASQSGSLNTHCSLPVLGDSSFVRCNFNNSVLYE